MDHGAGGRARCDFSIPVGHKCLAQRYRFANHNRSDDPENVTALLRGIDRVSWRSIAAACCFHSSIKLAEARAERILRLPEFLLSATRSITFGC